MANRDSKPSTRNKVPASKQITIGDVDSVEKCKALFAGWGIGDLKTFSGNLSEVIEGMDKQQELVRDIYENVRKLIKERGGDVADLDEAGLMHEVGCCLMNQGASPAENINDIAKRFPKYRFPRKGGTELLWHGIGRKPREVEDILKSEGKELKDFELSATEVATIMHEQGLSREKILLALTKSNRFSFDTQKVEGILDDLGVFPEEDSEKD